MSIPTAEPTSRIKNSIRTTGLLVMNPKIVPMEAINHVRSAVALSKMALKLPLDAVTKIFMYFPPFLKIEQPPDYP
jgi:hypothetical protein